MLNHNIIPDAINCSKSLSFTQIPNDLIRNPKISAKAKTILCILLSNTVGWKSYITKITEMMKEGKSAIQIGISELEKFGYVKRLKYRDKKTKQVKGSFWAYCDIPNQLNWEKQIQILDEYGMELIETNISEKTTLPKKPNIENQVVVSRSWKSATKNTNSKNTNIISFSRNKKNTNKCSSTSVEDNVIKKPSAKERNDKYLPIAEKLSEIIKTKKNITHTILQLKAWTNDIRRLVEDNGVTEDRINIALKWYNNNIGGEYIPVIESGSSLRNKFDKLESAMYRDKNIKINHNSQVKEIETRPDHVIWTEEARQRRLSELL